MVRTLGESDLVKDSKLETIFRHEYTIHIFDVSGETQRQIRREERWKKEEELGKGGFGIVWRETLVTDTGISRERAVKKIHKRADYVRELEAIAKFSHAKVRLSLISMRWESHGKSSTYGALCNHSDGTSVMTRFILRWNTFSWALSNPVSRRHYQSKTRSRSPSKSWRGYCTCMRMVLYTVI
jgi:hypothetical protein